LFRQRRELWGKPQRLGPLSQEKAWPRMIGCYSTHLTVTRIAFTLKICLKFKGGILREKSFTKRTHEIPLPSSGRGFFCIIPIRSRTAMNDIPDIPDDLIPEEPCLIPRDVSIYGFIAMYRIMHDNEPDTPPDKNKPSGPYIPLALRK
jgi:hypothetical protein